MTCVWYQIQALHRTRPTLPLGLGSVEGDTHDDVRRGTTTLFAALDGATGKGIGKWSQRHRHQECLAVLRPIDRETPPERDIHRVVDNDATHKHPRSKRSLQRDRATIFTSRRPPPHGSIRWSAGSASSANRPSSAARSTASLNASRRLRASSHNTMPPLRPSSGSRRRNRSSTSSNVYLRVFVEQDTSSLGRGRSSGTRNR